MIRWEESGVNIPPIDRPAASSHIALVSTSCTWSFWTHANFIRVQQSRRKRRVYLGISLVSSQLININVYATGGQDADWSDFSWQQNGLGNSSDYGFSQFYGKYKCYVFAIIWSVVYLNVLSRQIRFNSAEWSGQAELHPKTSSRVTNF